MVTKMRFDHEKFWRLSWYEVGLYVEQYANDMQMRREDQEMPWARFRIHWAQFHNANFKKKVKPSDLIRLSIDDRVPEYHEIDMDAMKRRFGSKLKKKSGQ